MSAQNAERPELAPLPCWQTEGVSGSRTCPRLPEMIHCRNCPVFCAAGRVLLDQPVPPAQLSEWTQMVAQTREENQRSPYSAVVFRIGGEWLALPTTIFHEIVPASPIRCLPHLRNGVLSGLCSIRGEIRLCVSLEALLGIPRAPEQATLFCVIGDENGDWLFPVQEVAGIHRYAQTHVQPVPAATQAEINLFSRGILDCDGRPAGLLDEGMLLHALKRSIR